MPTRSKPPPKVPKVEILSSDDDSAEEWEARDDGGFVLTPRGTQRRIAPAAPRFAPNLLAPYIRTWCFAESANYAMQPFLVPAAWHMAVMAALLAAAAATARADVFKATLVWRLLGHWACAPYAFESSQWSVYADLATLVALLLTTNDNDAVRAATPAVRTMFGVFYFAAAWWKVNTSFLDPSISCAPILVLQLVAAYVPAALTPPPSVLHLAARAAAPVTIIGEGAIGVLLLVPSSAPHARRLHALAVALTALLHIGISATPFPNQIASFSCICLLRVGWCALPIGWARAVRDAAGWRGREAAAAAAALAAAGALNTVPGVTFNFPLIAYAALTILAIRAIVRDAPLAPPADAVPAARRAAAAARALVVPCALYALVWPILGLTDLGLAGPFSSLRVHGGSNHLVVPTGLLQAAFASNAGGAFGGGVVRVSACTSEYILSVTLPDCSALLPPRARELLRAAGHSAVQHNPTVARNIDVARMLPEKFAPFTVPALELRRLLYEARARGEKFSLTYDVLPGATGGREWRAGKGVRTVKVSEGGGRAECRVVRGEGKGPCAADEIAEQPPPSGWVGKSVVFFAHPVEGEELPCMD